MAADGEDYSGNGNGNSDSGDDSGGYYWGSDADTPVIPPLTLPGVGSSADWDNYDLQDPSTIGSWANGGTIGLPGQTTVDLSDLLSPSNTTDLSTQQLSFDHVAAPQVDHHAQAANLGTPPDNFDFMDPAVMEALCKNTAYEPATGNISTGNLTGGPATLPEAPVLHFNDGAAATDLSTWLTNNGDTFDANQVNGLLAKSLGSSVHHDPSTGNGGTPVLDPATPVVDPNTTTTPSTGSVDQSGPTLPNQPVTYTFMDDDGPSTMTINPDGSIVSTDTSGHAYTMGSNPYLVAAIAAAKAGDYSSPDGSDGPKLRTQIGKDGSIYYVRTDGTIEYAVIDNGTKMITRDADGGKVMTAIGADGKADQVIAWESEDGKYKWSAGPNGTNIYKTPESNIISNSSGTFYYSPTNELMTADLADGRVLKVENGQKYYYQPGADGQADKLVGYMTGDGKIKVDIDPTTNNIRTTTYKVTEIQNADGTTSRTSTELQHVDELKGGIKVISDVQNNRTVIADKDNKVFFVSGTTTEERNAAYALARQTGSKTFYFGATYEQAVKENKLYTTQTVLEKAYSDPSRGKDVYVPIKTGVGADGRDVSLYPTFGSLAEQDMLLYKSTSLATDELIKSQIAYFDRVMGPTSLEKAGTALSDAYNSASNKSAGQMLSETGAGFVSGVKGIINFASTSVQILIPGSDANQSVMSSVYGTAKAVGHMATPEGVTEIGQKATTRVDEYKQYMQNTESRLGTAAATVEYFVGVGKVAYDIVVKPIVQDGLGVIIDENATPSQVGMAWLNLGTVASLGGVAKGSTDDIIRAGTRDIVEAGHIDMTPVKIDPTLHGSDVPTPPITTVVDVPPVGHPTAPDLPPIKVGGTDLPVGGSHDIPVLGGNDIPVVPKPPDAPVVPHVDPTPVPVDVAPTVTQPVTPVDPINSALDKFAENFPGAQTTPPQLRSEFRGDRYLESDMVAADGSLIAHVDYTIGKDGQLYIERLDVAETAQGKDVSKAVFAKILKDNPEITSIKAGTLQDTNMEVYARVLAETGDMETAIKATPAYKTRANMGFTELEFDPANRGTPEFITRRPLTADVPTAIAVVDNPTTVPKLDLPTPSGAHGDPIPSQPTPAPLAPVPFNGQALEDGINILRNRNDIPDAELPGAIAKTLSENGISAATASRFAEVPEALAWDVSSVRTGTLAKMMDSPDAAVRDAGNRLFTATQDGTISKTQIDHALYDWEKTGTVANVEQIGTAVATPNPTAPSYLDIDSAQIESRLRSIRASADFEPEAFSPILVRELHAGGVSQPTAQMFLDLPTDRVWPIAEMPVGTIAKMIDSTDTATREIGTALLAAAKDGSMGSPRITAIANDWEHFGVLPSADLTPGLKIDAPSAPVAAPTPSPASPNTPNLANLNRLTDDRIESLRTSLTVSAEQFPAVMARELTASGATPSTANLFSTIPDGMVWNVGELPVGTLAKMIDAADPATSLLGQRLLAAAKDGSMEPSQITALIRQWDSNGVLPKVEDLPAPTVAEVKPLILRDPVVGTPDPIPPLLTNTANDLPTSGLTVASNPTGTLTPGALATAVIVANTAPTSGDENAALPYNLPVNDVVRLGSIAELAASLKLDDQVVAQALAGDAFSTIKTSEAQKDLIEFWSTKDSSDLLRTDVLGEKLTEAALASSVTFSAMNIDDTTLGLGSGTLTRLPSGEVAILSVNQLLNPNGDGILRQSLSDLQKQLGDDGEIQLTVAGQVLTILESDMQLELNSKTNALVIKLSSFITDQIDKIELIDISKLPLLSTERPEANDKLLQIGAADLKSELSSATDDKRAFVGTEVEYKIDVDGVSYAVLTADNQNPPQTLNSLGGGIFGVDKNGQLVIYGAASNELALDSENTAKTLLGYVSPLEVGTARTANSPIATTDARVTTEPFAQVDGPATTSPVVSEFTPVATPTADPASTTAASAAAPAPSPAATNVVPISQGSASPRIEFTPLQNLLRIALGFNDEPSSTPSGSTTSVTAVPAVGTSTSASTALTYSSEEAEKLAAKVASGDLEAATKLLESTTALKTLNEADLTSLLEKARPSAEVYKAQQAGDEAAKKIVDTYNQLIAKALEHTQNSSLNAKLADLKKTGS